MWEIETLENPWLVIVQEMWEQNTVHKDNAYNRINDSFMVKRDFRPAIQTIDFLNNLCPSSN